MILKFGFTMKLINDNYLLMNYGNILKVVNTVGQISNCGFILGYCFKPKESFLKNL